MNITKKYLKIVGMVFCSLIMVTCLFNAKALAKENENNKMPEENKLVKAKVIENMEKQGKERKVKIIIEEGKYKGKELVVANELRVSDSKPLVLKKGQKVIVYISEDGEGNLEETYIYEFVREKYIMVLVAIFILLLLIIGGFKGFKSILTLVITGLFVIKILIPKIIKGSDPITTSISVCIGIIIVTLIILNGFHKKTLSAIIGTSTGVIIAGIIALIMTKLMSLSGIDEQAFNLMQRVRGVDFSFQGILFAGIILGALGAVMDVSMSIASSMHEIAYNSRRISRQEIIRAGMNVGKDAMGTMSNTLILAYAGGALNVIMFFAAQNISLTYIINSQNIASEIVRSLAGSIGLIITIPVTVFIAAFLEIK